MDSLRSDKSEDSLLIFGSVNVDGLKTRISKLAVGHSPCPGNSGPKAVASVSQAELRIQPLNEDNEGLGHQQSF